MKTQITHRLESKNDPYDERIEIDIRTRKELTKEEYAIIIAGIRSILDVLEPYIDDLNTFQKPAKDEK